MKKLHKKDIKAEFESILDLLYQTMNVFKKSRKPILVAMLFYGVMWVAVFLLFIWVIAMIAASHALNIIIWLILLGILSFLIIVLWMCLPTMMIVKITQNTLVNKENNVDQLVSECWKKIIWVWTTSLLVNIATIGRSLLLIIPWIYKSVQWLFTFVIATTSDKTNLEAMKYSKSLVKWRWRKTAIYWLAMWFLIAVISYILELVFRCLPDGLSGVLTSITSMMLSGAGIVYLTVLFHSRDLSK